MMERIKIIIPCFLAVALNVTSYGKEVVLPYSAFGPQVLAYKLIGKEWWQWLPEGGDDAEDIDFNIRVVVYWSVSDKEIMKKYPVIPNEKQDFRYIELSKAIGYLNDIIEEFGDDKSVDLTGLEKTLAKLKKLE